LSKNKHLINEYSSVVCRGMVSELDVWSQVCAYKSSA